MIVLALEAPAVEAHRAAGFVIAAIVIEPDRRLVTASAALGFFVAEPGSDFIAGALEKSMLVTVAVTAAHLAVAEPFARTSPLLAWASSRVIPVVCHLVPPMCWAARRTAGS